MGKRLYRDITIRGTVYPTVQHAARAFGIQDQTVLHAIKSGKLDTCGLGAQHPVAAPVRIRGKLYASAYEASKALGLSTSAIHNALNDGREDTVGLPQVRLGRPKPVQIGPYRFASMIEASRALGFKDNFVSHALRSGRKSSMEIVMAAAMKLEQKMLRERLKAERPELDEAA